MNNQLAQKDLYKIVKALDCVNFAKHIYFWSL